MYKACIFDLDGTLTDTLESLTYSVNATLTELNLPCITSEECRSFVGNGARFLMERALQASGDENLTYIEKAMDVYGRIFKEYCTYKVKTYDGIVEMLEELKRLGVKMAVLSNKPHLQTIDVVSTFFGEDTFVYAQGQMEGVPRKPDPTAALMIAEKLLVDREECVYIGDSEVDMKTASAAGMTGVGVTWGFRSEAVLLESGANHTINHPEELLSIVK